MLTPLAPVRSQHLPQGLRLRHRRRRAHPAGRVLHGVTSEGHRGVDVVHAEAHRVHQVRAAWDGMVFTYFTCFTRKKRPNCPIHPNTIRIN